MSISIQNSASAATNRVVTQSNKQAADAGYSLGTGKKGDTNTVVGAYIGSRLEQKALTLKAILDSTTYGISVLETALNGTVTLSNTVMEMNGVVAQSKGSSEDNTATLNDILRRSVELVKSQVSSAEFDGRQVLSGALGGSAAVTSDFQTKAASISGDPVAVSSGGNAVFADRGVSATTSIRVAANVPTGLQAGDTVRIANITFTAKSEETGKEGHFTIGTTPQETASNLAAAIKNHSSESLRMYKVSVRDDRVVVANIAAHQAAVDISTESAQAGALSLRNEAKYTVDLNATFAAGGTVTINGVTLTEGGAADFVQGANAGASSDNLAAAINANATLKALGISAVSDNANANVAIINRSVDTIRYSSSDANAAGVYNGSFEAQLGAAFAANGTVTISGVTLTEGVDFAAGNAAAASATALAAAINGNATLTALGITANADTANVELYNSLGDFITYSSSDANAVGVTTQSLAGTKSAIDVQGIRNIEDFIDDPAVSISLLSYEQGITAQSFGADRGATISNPASAAHPNDAVAIYSLNVAGKEFTGGIVQTNGDNLNDQAIKFTNSDTGEYFTVNYGSSGAVDISTEAGATTNANHIKTLIEGTRFSQTRELSITTGAGKIYNADGNEVGNLKGVRASLTSNNFDSKEIVDFSVDSSTTVGNIKFTTKIEDKNGNEQTFVADLPIAELLEGKLVAMKDADSNDVFEFNVGEGGLTQLTNIKNHNAVESAFKEAFFNTNAGLEIKTGVAVNEKLVAKISDMRIEKLFVDNDGVYVGNLSVTTEDDARRASEAITNALRKITSETSGIRAQLNSVRNATTALQEKADITQSTASKFTDANLLDAAKDFSEALLRAKAAVSTFQAVGRNQKELIENLIREL